MGIAEALGSLILGWHKAGQLQGWLRLLFSITFSFVLAFNTAMGTALVAGKPGLFALGCGLLSGSAMAFVAYQSANKAITADTVVAVAQKTVEDRYTDGRGPMTSQPPEK